MGISPSIILEHFSSTHAADMFTATTAFNLLFEEDSSPNPTPELDPGIYPIPKPRCIVKPRFD